MDIIRQRFPGRLIGPLIFIAPLLIAIGLTSGCNTNSSSTTTSTTTTSTIRQTTIAFAGRTWAVKNYEASQVGPGPNYFSNSSNNVWVDAAGQLHLKITHRNNAWQCAEVVLQENLGYGKYIFHLAGRPDLIDQNVVLGLFTWDDTSSDAASRNYREMDIEISRWSDPTGKELQFTVQPFTRAGNTNFRQFNLDLSGYVSSSHIINWQSSAISFESAYGYTATPAASALIATWEYTGADIPNPGLENARINLWLNGGTPPSNSSEAEVVIHDFQFIYP